MPIDKVIMQYPEECIKYDNYHNVVVPNRGDYIMHNGEEYRVKYRIFDPQGETVTVVLLKLEEEKY